MDEKIEKAISKLLKMYEKIENDLLVKIASHFSINEEFLNSDYWRIKKLEEMGLFNQDIIDYLKRETKKTDLEIKNALNEIGIETINLDKFNKLFEDEMLKINPNILINNYTIKNIINTAYNELSNSLIKMSSKIEKSTREAYLNIVEEAYLKTSMGTHSYQEAIRESINQLSNKGIKSLTYKTIDDNGDVIGLRDYDIESAVRREVLTASRKLNNNIAMEIANELECEYLYLSEHLQCRPSHFDWQGTVIKKEQLEVITHYGEIDGLAGINCRHYFEPYFGEARANDLKTFNKEECTNAYNLSQHQRYIERGIRKWKRKANMFRTNDDNEALKKSNYKVAEWQRKLKEFTEENSNKRDYTREYVSNYKQVRINLKPTKDNIDILNNAGIIANDSLGKINQNLLKRNANQLYKLSQKYNIKDFYIINGVEYYCTNEKYVAAIGYNNKMTSFSINSSYRYFKDKKTIVESTKESIIKNWSMPCKEENYDIYSMTHEFGHTLEMKMFKDSYPLGGNDEYTIFSNDVKNDIIKIAKKNNTDFEYNQNIGNYGKRNAKEFFAEVFANMELGKTNELGKAMKEYLIEKGVLK